MVDIFYDEAKKKECEELKNKLSLLNFIVKRMIRLYHYEKHKTHRKLQLDKVIEAGKWFSENFKKNYKLIKNTTEQIIFE